MSHCYNKTKVKLSEVFNYAPRHEGLQGSGSTHPRVLISEPGAGQQLASSPGRFNAQEKGPVPTGQEDGWRPGSV
jgi:hypothetical protein